MSNQLRKIQKVCALRNLEILTGKYADTGNATRFVNPSNIKLICDYLDLYSNLYKILCRKLIKYYFKFDTCHTVAAVGPTHSF